MKCEHERICENCKLDKSGDCFNCFNGLDHRKFSCKLCKENKPLTIAELEQMDGLPVWMVIPLIKTNKSEWVLVNVSAGRVYDNEGEIYYFSNFNNDKICCYKEKPTPRMVTFSTLVNKKLKLKGEGYINYLSALANKLLDLNIRGKLVGTEAEKLFTEECWEVKED